MNSIITFYSYKGGVGRTMALANIAVLLVRMGKRVLVVDWDLEAPGLDRYFRGFEIQNKNDGAGLLDLLIDTQKSESPEGKPHWKDYLSYIELGDKHPLTLLTSGRQDQDYAQKVLDFDWNSFFDDSDGGDFIESLRKDWLKEFDVTLIDSRTGITDSGGICTIQLPDILVPVFTTNEQSLQGAKQIAIRAQQARQKLAFDRMPLLTFPLISRFDSRTEYKEAQQWLKTFAEELSPFYDDWLPKTHTPLQIIERTKIPYIAYFSFGEKLPAVTDGVSDPEGLGYAYRAAATLIAGEFRDAEKLITTGLSGIRQNSDKDESGLLSYLRRKFRSTRFRIGIAALAIILILILAWFANVQYHRYDALAYLKDNNYPSELYGWQQQLKTLALKDRMPVQRFPWLHSDSLEEITIKVQSGTSSLDDLAASLAKCGALKKLNLDLSGSEVSDLRPLTRLTNLTQLSLYLKGSQVRDLTPLTKLTNLTQLSLNLGDDQVRDLTPLTKLTNLTQFSLNLGFSQANDLTPLTKLTNLTQLSLYLGTGQANDLTPLTHLPNLTQLSLHFLGSRVRDLTPLTNLPNLTQLSLEISDNQVSDLTSLTKLTNLTQLSLYLSFSRVRDLTPLTKLTNLTQLTLNLSGTQVSDLTPLTNLPNLTYLSLDTSNSEVSDLTPLTKVSCKTLVLTVDTNQRVSLKTIPTGLTHLEF